MTSRAHIEVTADLLESVAFAHRLTIERSIDDERMYLTLDGVTYWSPIGAVAA